MEPVTQRAKEKKRPFVAFMAAIVLAVAALDQAVKALMVSWLEPGVPQPVLGDWFRFLLLFNPGAAFSMGQGSTWLFTCFQIAFIAGVAVAAPRVRDPWTALGLALVGGGALGNLIDRLFRAPQFFLGHVVDYISVGGFAVFNIADACISVGVVIFIIGMLLDDRAAARAREEG
ncbi:signal peptidase II [Corynebacterium mastitidis]|uniref:Lipoprotein signal peptidase n=1 Tax=Corynebacterium mastitidis TaxID=161890 RepID=A0A2N0X7I0_9CORY|nr:signal peptidase II [Corynebacterium mastitidis]MCH6196767.1 signal peptidase II [Corynebacterium mastitidis]PKF68661.1 signal peptidase II [Corynebacterium mastitidis]